MRRGVGIAGLQKKAQAQAQYKNMGNAVAAESIASLTDQFNVFKDKLVEFARKHAKDIQKNPAFRNHFNTMCSKIGVDPLASSKGFWAEVLGVGDFYFELGVQIIDVCLELREETGGFVEVSEVQRRLLLKRSSAKVTISEEDMDRAISTLKPLGSYFKIVSLGNSRLIQCTPKDLSVDHVAILSHLGEALSMNSLQTALGWPKDRIKAALENMIETGMVWIDDHDGEILYWVTGLMANKVL